VSGRRLALLADVHGNLPALEAVLGDIEGAGIGAGDAYCLGDLVGYGPDPAGVVARVRGAGIPTVRGNYDDGIGFRRGQCGCYYVTEQAKLDGAASYAFTDAALSDADHDWLAALPDSIRFTIGSRRMLLAHGSPRKINEYLLPDRTDAFLARLADAAAADVVCVGHVHMPYHRIVCGATGQRIDYVSVPSAGKPKNGDPRAGWTELRFGEDSVEFDVRVHRVAYDVEAVAVAMLAAGLPPTLAEALTTA
jgi:predicted phosphodiesterase